MINKRNTMRSLFILFLYGLLQPLYILAQDVKIGKQVWMSKNLDVSTFRNGDTIYHAKERTDWYKAAKEKKAAWCYIGFNGESGYGKHYNWFAFIDPRGLAPRGYHLPSLEEWNKLILFLRKGGKVGLKLKSKNGYYCKGGNGSNSSGFDGLPGGLVTDDGFGNDSGFIGYWWHSDKDSLFSWTIKLSCYNNNQDLEYYSAWKTYGISVRCIKD